MPIKPRFSRVNPIFIATNRPPILILALLTLAALSVAGCDFSDLPFDLPVSVADTGDPTIPPAAPTNMTAGATPFNPAVTAASNGNDDIVIVELAWDDNANNELGYSARGFGISAGNVPFPVGSLSANPAMPVQFGPLACEGTFAFMVAAYNAAGTSAEACVEITMPSCADITQPPVTRPCATVVPAQASASSPANQPGAGGGQGTAGGQATGGQQGSTDGQGDGSGGADTSGQQGASGPQGSDGQQDGPGLLGPALAQQAGSTFGGSCGQMGDGPETYFYDCYTDRCLWIQSDACGISAPAQEVQTFLCGTPDDLCANVGGGVGQERCGDFGDGAPNIKYDCPTMRCLSVPTDLCGNAATDSAATELGVIACGDPARICASTDAQFARCGDGKLSDGEACDVGIPCANAGHVCNESACTCAPPPPVCGNGVLDAGEFCETNSPCASNFTCQDCQCYFNDTCGNGTLEPDKGEHCEDNSDCGAGQTCQACQCYNS